MRNGRLLCMLLAAPLVIGACSESGQLTSPRSPISPTSIGTELTSVSPQGGMTGVSPAAQVSFGFGGPMATGTEAYCDLHQGGLDGPVVPMTCGWSADRTTLTCDPAAALRSEARYTIHMGGGLRDADGHPLGFETHGPMFGGQWVQGSQISGFHGGVMGWGMMGAGWRHANGSYGMAFSFTTGR